MVGAKTGSGTDNTEKELNMTLSDQLTKLAARAKDAEDRVAAAKTKARAELEQDVQEARESAQTQADELRKTAEADKDKISAWWAGVQKSWNEHLGTIRRNMDEKRAKLDTKVAKTDADMAEDEAVFAVDFAIGTVEEAEYAALYAVLARANVEGMAAGSPS
jgi:hypothetical protein